MIKTRTWLIIIGVLFILSVLTTLILERRQKELGYVNIYVENTCIYSVSLANVDSPIEYTVTLENGETNTVLIEKNRVCMIDATCSDKVCVHTGYVHDSSKPIICLPHRLVVRLEKKSKNGFDTIVR